MSNVSKIPGPVERVFVTLLGKDGVKSVKSDLLAGCEALHAWCVELAGSFQIRVDRRSSPNEVLWHAEVDGEGYSSSIPTRTVLRDPGMILVLLLQARDSLLIVTGKTTQEGLALYLAERGKEAPRKNPMLGIMRATWPDRTPGLKEASARAERLFDICLDIAPTFQVSHTHLAGTGSDSIAWFARVWDENYGGEMTPSAITPPTRVCELLEKARDFLLLVTGAAEDEAKVHEYVRSHPEVRA